MKNTNNNEKGDNNASSNKKIEEENDNPDIHRAGVIELLDDFIGQVLFIRKTLFTVSLSAMLLAPVSISLCIYLFVHPSFLRVLDAKDDFGQILTVLLISVIAVSAIWLTVGIKQYISINSWSKRYAEYQQAQLKMQKKLEEEFGLFPE